MISSRPNGRAGNSRRYKEWEEWGSKQKDARARWVKLNTVTVAGDSPTDFPFLDIADMPRFQEQAGALLSGLEASVLEGGLLSSRPYSCSPWAMSRSSVLT